MIVWRASPIASSTRLGVSVDAVQADRFWILTHAEFETFTRPRFEEILAACHGRGIMTWANATDAFSSDYNGFRPNRGVAEQYTWLAPGAGQRSYEPDAGDWKKFATLADFRVSMRRTLGKRNPEYRAVRFPLSLAPDEPVL